MISPSASSSGGRLPSRRRRSGGRPRLSAEFFRQHSQASSSTQRRKKKRKKKKLPRGGRAHRRHRLWHVRAPRTVFPSFGGRPRYLAFWWSRSSLTPPAAYARLVLLVFHLAVCSILSFSGPRCSASWPVWTRRTIMCLAGLAGDDSPRAVFLICLHAQDARHFGRRPCFRIRLFGSTVDTYVSVQRPGSCLRLQKTVESPQLQSIVGRRLFPVVAQRQIPMVLFRMP